MSSINIYIYINVYTYKFSNWIEREILPKRLWARKKQTKTKYTRIKESAKQRLEIIELFQREIISSKKKKKRFLSFFEK